MFAYSSALHISLVRSQGFSLMVTAQISTTLKVNGMTEDILFAILFGQKIFCVWTTDTKKPIFMPTTFLPVFYCL